MVTALYFIQLSEGFSVRCANSWDDLQWVTKSLMSNWVRPAQEEKWYLTAGLTHSFYIGEVDGKRISSISFIKHSKSMGFASSYFVDKAYRGMGYGQKTLQAVYTRDILESYKIYGYATPSLQDFYYKNLQLQSGWSSRRYRIHNDAFMRKKLSCLYPASATQILPANLANFKQLMEYSVDMVVSSQISQHLLSAMLMHSQKSSWVAFGNKGEIVGYLIISKTKTFPEGGYLIRPLFADNGAVACNLLREAAEYVNKDANNPSLISLDMSTLNLEGVKIMENELEAETVDDRVFMGNKGIPQKAHEKMFGLASLDAL